VEVEGDADGVVAEVVTSTGRTIRTMTVMTATKAEAADTMIDSRVITEMSPEMRIPKPSKWTCSQTSYPNGQVPFMLPINAWLDNF